MRTHILMLWGPADHMSLLKTSKFSFRNDSFGQTVSDSAMSHQYGRKLNLYLLGDGEP